MADKNLDELMKDLNTYTVQVAEEKKKAKADLYKEPFVFPWKYLILAVGVATWYFWKPIHIATAKIAGEPQVQRILNLLDQSEDIPVETISGAKAKQESLRESDSAKSLSIEPFAPVVAEERKPAASNNNLVQIDGRWYKKTADNIYYINGRRVFFVDNRKRAEETPAQ